MYKRICFATAAFAAFAPSPASAQEAGSRQTRDFVRAAAQSDTFEIRESEAALAQSADPQVRAFAQRMIVAHGSTSDALKAAAARAGLEPPSEGMSSDQALLLGALQTLRGSEFDTAYVRHQELAHRSALAVEQQYASGGEQPDVRAAAAAATPIIASHLAMAQQMQAPRGR